MPGLRYQIKIKIHNQKMLGLDGVHQQKYIHEVCKISLKYSSFPDINIAKVFLFFDYQVDFTLIQPYEFSIKVIKLPKVEMAKNQENF